MATATRKRRQRSLALLLSGVKVKQGDEMTSVVGKVIRAVIVKSGITVINCNIKENTCERLWKQNLFHYKHATDTCYQCTQPN